MVNQFCHYCQSILIKIGDKYSCPIHGFVLQEVDEEPEENRDKSYIG